MNKIFIPIIFLLIIIIGISGCINFLGGNTSNSSVKTYTGYSVSFNYPEAWTLTTFTLNGGSGHMINIMKNTSFNPTLVEVQMIPNNGMSDQEAINEMGNSTMDNGTSISNDTIIIDNITAYESTFFVNNTHLTDMRVAHVYFEKNHTLYSITMQSRNITFDRDKPSFDIILKSFKVLNN